MTTKGAFTQIDTSGNRAVIVARKVLYMDGYDAFVCVMEGRGETEKRTGKPTEYAFTFDQTKKVIYLSEGYRTEAKKTIVRQRTLEVNRTDAGAIINSGITLKWLTPEESEQLKKEYQAILAERKVVGKEFNALVPTSTEDAKDEEVREQRYRCKKDGKMLPKGRQTCRYCHGTDIEPVK